MDLIDPSTHLDDHLMGSSCSYSPDLADLLTVANISQGMDPLQAALDARLQAPLIHPFLF